MKLLSLYHPRHVVVVSAATAFLTIILSLSPSSLASEQHLRRQQQQLLVSDPISSSSCNDLSDQDACMKSVDKDTGKSCEWCIAGAIPSECMSQEQASQLPSGVFDCKQEAPSGSFSSFATATATADAEEESSVPLLSLGEYSFVEGLTHAITTDPPENSDLCDASSKSISGYMTVKGSEYDKKGEDKHLFFWMFEKRGNGELHHDETTPFVVWLTGGPGCSSTLALLTENGPCSVNKDGKTTTVNPYSWTEVAHVLWLDQPAGVGFSYGAETDYNEKMVAEDAYYFFQAFFQTHTEYAGNPLYIVGESYAGHYVPAIAHRVWTGNKKLAPNTVTLSFAGLAVGNGLTDPERQYPWYPEMVYNNSHGIQVVSKSTYESMKAVVPRCTALIHQCNQGDNTIDTFACQSAFLVCNMGLTSPYQMTGMNPYDIRIKCAKPPLCYDFSHVGKWLNLESTKEALNVDSKHSHNWESCNFGINMKFHTDWMKDFAPYVADLLNDGIPALMYAGDVDFICNYLGNAAWTYQLEWNHQAEFQAADVHDWNKYALARTANNFTFLQVYDAGHMVPSDQPAGSLEMMKHWLSGGTF